MLQLLRCFETTSPQLLPCTKENTKATMRQTRKVNQSIRDSDTTWPPKHADTYRTSEHALSASVHKGKHPDDHAPQTRKVNRSIRDSDTTGRQNTPTHTKRANNTTHCLTNSSFTTSIITHGRRRPLARRPWNPRCPTRSSPRCPTRSSPRCPTRSSLRCPTRP